MDTLIFGGLLAALVVLYQDRPRKLLLTVWWVVLFATVALLAHHITSSLKLGLSY
ncbi:hypothetical protein H9Y04_39540 [Streptomyces sp. TRM66268-LWL]|uniref:Inner membrane protein n=1 Tax=Streptomyces polyasparticus TaxID=2767826 RepID=A0ABR7SUM1_9ACTN|nr:DUF5993 family protein [Streptomyces polyasparticus]MBC9718637.1 hypothetical protein [Streptomyces polyasparticus]